MLIKLLEEYLFKRVRGLGEESLKYFNKHLVCNGDSYLKWNIINNISLPFLHSFRIHLFHQKFPITIPLDFNINVFICKMLGFLVDL